MRFIEKVYKFNEEHCDFIEEQLQLHNIQNYYIELKPDVKPLLKIYNDLDDVQNSVSFIQSLELELVQETEIGEKDWLAEWLESLEAFELAPDIWINPHPDKDLKKKDGIVIHLIPGSAFGTGLHATTRLCARLMQKISLEQSMVLDIGCGTGILSALACKKHACVTALDIDKYAIIKTKEVFKLNNIQATVHQSDLLNDSPPKGPFDLIVANIIYEVHEMLFNSIAFRDLLHDKTQLIFSGVSHVKNEKMLELLQRHSFQLIENLQEGDWHAYHVKCGNPQLPRESLQ